MKVLFFVALFAALNFAQELNCRVTVNYESLPVVNRELLVDFAVMIEDYMNKTRFTQTEWQGGKIDCSMNIFLTGAADETNYSAQVVITSQRPIYQTKNNSLMLSISDNQWGFSYVKNQALYSNQSTYDPLASFLDYYAYIIIGYDMDSYEKLGGQPYFTKAFDIVNLAQSSRYTAGWERNSSSYSRRGLVENLLNEKYRSFREAFFNYHFNGLDVFPKNKMAGLEQIVNLVETISGMRSKLDFNSVLLKVFFDAKHGEISDRLKSHPNKNDILRTLKKIDPAHISKYDEAMS